MVENFSESLLECLENITDKIVDLNSKLEDLQGKIEGSEERLTSMEEREDDFEKEDIKEPNISEETSTVEVEEPTEKDESKEDKEDEPQIKDEDDAHFFSQEGYIVVRNKVRPYGVKVIHTSEFSESLYKPVYSTVFSQRTRAYCAKSDFENNNITRYCRVK